ncbi:MAG: hypothetical protein V4695_00365 [Pseudomonadota bacterium]
MSFYRFQYVHPLIAAAAVSVVLVSILGVANLTGVLPELDTVAASAPKARPILPARAETARVGTPVVTTPLSEPRSGIALKVGAVTTSSQSKPNTGPAVYVHVLDEAARKRVALLAPSLEKNGIALAGIKVVPAAPARSDLRYFRQTEKAEALKVQAALVAMGLPAQRLKRIDGMEPLAKRRQYELWLSEG